MLQRVNGMVGLVLSLWLLAPAWAASLIVMEARGGGFKVGQAIDSDKPIALKAGERLTLIGPDGSKVALRGPFNEAPLQKSAVSTDSQKALGALVANRAARTSTAGVIRAGGVAANLPEPWLIDVSRPGVRCIQQGARPVFWRPDASKLSKLVVAPADRSFKTEFDWPAGLDRITMPESSRFQNQNLLRVALDGQEFAIGLTEIPQNIDNPLVLVAWMAEKSCLQQSDALVTMLQGAP
jgi:hypothetical protein